MAAVLAALVWQLIGWIGDSAPDGTAAPFADMEFAPPLIKGDGLGDGSAALPWPADVSVPGPGRTGGEAVEAYTRREARLPSPLRKSSVRPSGRYSAGSALPIPEQSFGALDRNEDGRLSPAEFAIYRLRSLQPARKGMKADDLPPYVPTSALNTTIVEFRPLDEDNDWFLSRPEFAAAARTTSSVELQ
jgi:hypothetical protein